ncbi:hypothetical protein HaLaN_14305 [Haematococcus lacustris]|uniref:Uncharacterized protein n=1 Tax=Haematococcus lacustris TaxID=44745 RepID=A0A699Z685_HAELA|nr:hypothetical protein HaLaN_14305 [Haematococcus lacustris]
MQHGDTPAANAAAAIQAICPVSYCQDKVWPQPPMSWPGSAAGVSRLSLATAYILATTTRPRLSPLVPH